MLIAGDGGSRTYPVQNTARDDMKDLVELKRAMGRARAADAAKRTTESARKKATDAVGEYKGKVKDHQKEWVRENGHKHHTDASLNTAWQAAWEKDGKQASAELAPVIADYNKAVEDELQIAEQAAGTDRAARQAARAEKAKEIAARESGGDADKILDGITMDIAKETPEQVDTKMALNNVIDAGERLTAAQNSLKQFQDLPSGIRNAEGDSYTQLQADVDEAEADYMAAMSRLTTSLDAELTAELNRLYGPGEGGKYTKEQRDKAVGNLNALHGPQGLTPLIAGVNATQAVVGDVQTEMDKIEADLDSLTPAERTLWDKDPVTLVFMKAAGLTYDPDNPNVSALEREVAKEQPHIYALMQLTGVGFEEKGGQLWVTKNGKTEFANSAEMKAYRNQGGTFALASQVLSNLPEGAFTQETRDLMLGADMVRLNFVSSEMERRMSGANPDMRGALDFLNTNIGATFSPDTQALMWQQSGEPYFGREWSDAQVRSFGTDMDGLGRWMQDVIPVAPAPAINNILNSVKEIVPTKPGEGGYQTNTNLRELWSGISLGIEAVPARADEFADWIMTASGGQMLYTLQTSESMFYNSTIRSSVADGNGSTLATALVGRMAQSDQFKGQAEDLDFVLDLGIGEANEKHSLKISERQYQDFLDHKADRLNDHFDSFLGDPLLKKPLKVNKGAETVEFRNAIGRALGLTPNQNQDAAKLGPNRNANVSWYADGSYEAEVINVTIAWIEDQSDANSYVTLLPVLYTANTAGTQGGAVFKVARGDGEQVIIDGQVADDVVDAALGDPSTTADDKPIEPTEAHVNWHYTSLSDLTDNSNYADDGRIYMPADWTIADKDGDHHVDLTDIDAARMTAGDWVKLGVSGVAAVASIAAAPFTGGGSLVVLGLATAWGGFMVYDQLDTMQDHGQSLSWDNPNARMAYLNGGMALVGGASLGAGRLAQGITNINRPSGMFFSSAAARFPALPRAYVNGLTTAARMPGGAQTYAMIAQTTGKASMAWGGGNTGAQGFDLVENWDLMSVEERVNASVYGLLGVVDAASGFAGNKLAQQKPSTARVTFEDDGAITYVKKDGAEPRVLHAAFDPETPLTLAQLCVQQLETLLRDTAGIPADRTAAAPKTASLDDAAFEYLHMTLNGGYKGRKNVDAFTIFNSDGDPVMIVLRNRPTSKSKADEQILHELTHFYMDKLFARQADGVLIGPSDPVLSYFPSATLLEGIAQYVAWRVNNQGGEDGATTYRAYLDDQIARFKAGENIRLTYPHATLEAEKIATRMGEAEMMRAVFRGDEDARLTLFHGIKDDLSEMPVQSETDALPLGSRGDWALAASVTQPNPRPPRRERIRQLVHQGWVRTQNGWEHTKTGWTWTKDHGESAIKATWRGVVWAADGTRTVSKEGSWRVGNRSRNGVRHVRDVAFGGTVPFKALARRAQAGRMAYAGKVATSFDQLAVQLDPAGLVAPTYLPSPFVKDLANGIQILGKLTEVFGDIHAHSRPYERRWNYPVRGISRFERLTRMAGPYGRILIGDIPQYCGFGHYSHAEPDGLSLAKAERLDRKNSKAYGGMVRTYETWARTMDKVETKFGVAHPKLADEIETAAISGDRDAFNQKLDELRRLKGGQRLARSLQDQTRVDLRTGLYRDPFLALRSALSLTGFDPGDAGSVARIRQKMLERPGGAAFLGEITLQKELVDVMLGKDATLLNQAGVAVLQRALVDLRASGDLPAFKAALETFKGDTAYQYVQALVEDTHGVITKLNSRIDKAAKLDAKRTQIEDDAQILRHNLDTALTAKNTDLAAYIGDKTALEGEIRTLEGENSRLLSQQAPLRGVTGEEAEVARLQGLIDANLAEIAARQTRNSALDSKIAGLQKIIDSIPQTRADYARDRDKALARTDRKIRVNKAKISKLSGELDKFLVDFDTDQKNKIENFKGILKLAQESGLGVLIHCDWGHAGKGGDHRPKEATTDYAFYDDLIKLVAPYTKPGAEGRHAKVVLAHTGFGRLTKPDDSPVSFTHSATSPVIAKRGQTETMPEHIARLYKAMEAAPNLRFDISWNDVGERYVINPELMAGLKGFMEDHPDAVIFGTDTVKPVNQEQYLQAFTELVPMFMTMARDNPDMLWNLLRGNFHKVMHEAETDVAAWTAAELPRAHTLRNQQPKIDRMLATRARLDAGQDKLVSLGRDRFDEIIAEWRSDPSHLGRTETELAGYGVEPISVHVPAGGYDIGRGRTALLGRAIDRDTKGETKAAAAQDGTAAGAPATKRGQLVAKAQAGARLVAVAGGSAAGLAIDNLLGAASADAASGGATGSSALRQMLFFGRLAYREYVRLSWDTLFEDGAKLLFDDKGNPPSPTDIAHFHRNIDIFLNRTFKLGKVYGVDEADLGAIVALSGHFKADANYIIQRGEADGWPWRRKRQALMSIIGNYQIRVDRALGLQAGSMDMFSPLTRSGRRMNDGILLTSVAGLAASVYEVEQLFRQIHTDWLSLRTGMITEDMLALSLVAAVQIVANKSGKANTSLSERQILVNRLQGTMLSVLALRGATGTADDVMHLMHALDVANQSPDVQETFRVAADIFEALKNLDLNALSTGSLTLDTLLSAVVAFGPVAAHGAAGVSNAVVTWQGFKAAYYEWARQTSGGGPDRGQVARTNELLVTALFASAILHHWRN